MQRNDMKGGETSVFWNWNKENRSIRNLGRKIKGGQRVDETKTFNQNSIPAFVPNNGSGDVYWHYGICRRRWRDLYICATSLWLEERHGSNRTSWRKGCCQLGMGSGREWLYSTHQRCSHECRPDVWCGRNCSDRMWESFRRPSEDSFCPGGRRIRSCADCRDHGWRTGHSRWDEFPGCPVYGKICGSGRHGSGERQQGSYLIWQRV